MSNIAVIGVVLLAIVAEFCGIFIAKYLGMSQFASVAVGFIAAGDSYDEALSDIKSAINFHIETFGDEAFETDSPILEAFIAETKLAA
jgi:hypothetical protein